ncbi:MAG: SOS response-associated peptidase [candidate division NC10 bacterium]|nr:SOS response-associated peptidase [candidate division NC10 bacterium]
MCGRFSLGTPASTLATQFELFEAPAWAPRYNIGPTQSAPTVVRAASQLARRFTLHRWGLIPPWAKDPGIGSRLINARAETVATKPAFRQALRERRCLILADGFYEWQRRGRHKQPFHIRMLDGRPFAFAGLWEHWEGPEGTVIDSCTILTTTANELVGALHDRMPVILAPQDYDVWLDPAIQEVERLEPLLRPYPAEEMTAHPVSTRVNNPANDSPACVEPPP